IRPLPSTPSPSPPNNSRKPSSSRSLPTPNRPGSPPCSYFVFSFFARSVAGLHLSQQARLIKVNSLRDQLLRRFITVDNLSPASALCRQRSRAAARVIAALCLSFA